MSILRTEDFAGLSLQKPRTRGDPSEVPVIVVRHQPPDRGVDEVEERDRAQQRQQSLAGVQEQLLAPLSATERDRFLDLLRRVIEG
jgi:hypothetical protein